MFREATTEFSVDARALTKAGGPHVKTRVSNPSGNLTESYVRDNGDGTYHVEYTPYEDGERAVQRQEGAFMMWGAPLVLMVQTLTEGLWISKILFNACLTSLPFLL